MTLHQFRKCYDQMIDGKPEDYQSFWDKLDAASIYSSSDEFTLGMLYDENNPSSILSALNRAMDNAILLREDIFTETLSYIELSINRSICPGSRRSSSSPGAASDSIRPAPDIPVLSVS